MLAEGLNSLLPYLKLWFRESRDSKDEYSRCCLAPNGVNCSKMMKNIFQGVKQAYKKIGEPVPDLKPIRRPRKVIIGEDGQIIVQKRKRTPKKEKLENSSQVSIEESFETLESELVLDDSPSRKKKRSSISTDSKEGLKLKLSLVDPKAPKVTLSEIPSASSGGDQLVANQTLPKMKIALAQRFSKGEKSKRHNPDYKYRAPDIKPKIIKDIEEELEIKEWIEKLDDKKISGDFVYFDLETPDEEAVKKR